MEFRFSSSARIASYIFSVLFFAGGIFLFGYAFFSQVYFIFIGPFLIGIGWYLLKEVRSSCLTLNDDSITLINSSSFRTLPLSDIQGFRLLDKGGIEILPVPGGIEKKMTISSSFENKEEIQAWLEKHLPNIDAITVQQETESILADEHFGFSETDRANRLKQAKQTAKLVNIVAYIVFFWSFIYPVPYNVVIVLLLVVPFIALVVIWHFKGLVRITDGKKTAYPSVISAVLLTLVLLIRALLDYDIYDYARVYKPVTIMLVIILPIAWWLCRELYNQTAQKSSTLISLLVCLCCYAYGSVVVINCYYDKTPGKVFTVPVKGKHISTGKHTSYYLNLDAWGQYTEPDDVEVSPDLYNAEKEGDMVNVYLKSGYLGIPWFWVGKIGE